MSVTQFCEHVTEHLEELGLRHLVVHAYLIFMIYLIPVESVLMLFVFEEAIVLIDNLPQSLEVASRRVSPFLLVDAGGKCPKSPYSYYSPNSYYISYKIKYLLHNLCGIKENRRVKPIRKRCV